MHRPARRSTPSARLLAAALVAALASACGGPAVPSPAVAPMSLAAQAERDTTSIRVIKTAIKKHFEVVTMERIVRLTSLAIVPAPAWNEFVYEGTMVEDDLETGIYTFRVAGIFDAVSKEVEVKSKELIDFAGVDPRAPRGSDR